MILSNAENSDDNEAKKFEASDAYSAAAAPQPLSAVLSTPVVEPT
jgi:hypothetical protein